MKKIITFICTALLFCAIALSSTDLVLAQELPVIQEMGDSEQSVEMISTGLKAVNNSGTIKLTWDAVEGAEGYIIYRRVGDGSFTYLYMTSNTGYSDSKAVLGEYNFYRVYPYKYDSTGKRIMGKSGSYVYSKAVPKEITNLKATYSGNGTVKLTWTASGRAQGYIIYRRIGDGSFEYRYMVSGTSYTDTTASSSQYNYYRVYPYVTDTKGVKVLGPSKEYVYDKLPEVGSLKATANKQRAITVSWTKTPGATGYIIYEKRADESAFSYAGMTSNASYTTKNHKPDTFYFYRVYGYRFVNGKRVLGPSLKYVYAKAATSTKLLGLTNIDGEYYYYLSDGALRKGFSVWSDIGRAYFDEETGKMYLGLTYVPSNGNTYYFLEGGGTKSGLQKLDGKYYYFHPSYGDAMATNKAVKVGDKLLYLGSDGVAFTGLKEVNGYTYWLDPEEDDGKYHGIKEIDGKIYYFHASSGLLITNTAMKIDGKMYYFDETGAAYTGLKKINGYTYWLDPKESDGKYRGFKKISGKTYYFNSGNGEMVIDIVMWIDGKLYWFNTSGVLSSGLKDVDGYTYYLDPEAEDGKYRGFKEISGKTYYFNDVDGEMVKSVMVIIDNKKNYFDADGARATGVRNVVTDEVDLWYYFDPATETGVRTGFQEYEGNTYYFETEAGLMRFGFWSFDDVLYYLDYESGKMLKSGSVTQAGIKFTADADGELTWSVASGYSNDIRANIIVKALSKLGYPYTTEANGYVCSTLVAYAYNEEGIDVLNNKESFEQAITCKENGWFTAAGKNVNIDDVILPGDLIFWQNLACEEDGCDHTDEVHHIGIYLGKGQVVEASEVMGLMLVRDIQEDDNFKIYGYADIVSDY